MNCSFCSKSTKVFKLGDVEFIDAQEMSRKHPKTFEGCSQGELDAIREGDSVRIASREERFWTLVKKVNGDVITAEVINVLIIPQRYDYGDVVQYEKRHVHDIECRPRSRSSRLGGYDG